MVNSVKADLYRLFHSRAVWIVNLIHVLLIQASLFLTAPRDNSGAIMKLSAVDQVTSLSSNFFFVEAFVVVILTMILGADLSNKLYKNTLSSGQSRLQFFFGKNVTMIIVAFMQFVIFYGLTFVETAVLNSVGHFGNDFTTEFCKMLVVQFLCVIVWISVVGFVLYLTRSNTAGVVIFFVGLLVLPILQTSFPKVTLLKYLNFSVGMGSGNEILTNSALGAIGVIVVFSILSIVRFKKEDL